MLKLRGHHLLCAMTFSGHGYSREFESDFQEAIRKMRNGEAIQIVIGPDDLCRSVKCGPNSHCFESRVQLRDELALADISRLLGRSITADEVIDPRELYGLNMQRAFKQGDIRSACFRCQWQSMCNEISNQGYRKSWLFKVRMVQATENPSWGGLVSRLLLATMAFWLYISPDLYSIPPNG